MNKEKLEKEVEKLRKRNKELEEKNKELKKILTMNYPIAPRGRVITEMYCLGTEGKKIECRCQESSCGPRSLLIKEQKIEKLKGHKEVLEPEAKGVAEKIKE